MTNNDFLQSQLDFIKQKNFDNTIEWQDITDFRNETLGINEARDTIRKGAKLLQEYIDAGWDIKPNSNSSVNFCQTNEIHSIQKERMKLQAEKIELNKNLRELARDELIVEHIKSAISTLPKMEIPKPISISHSDKSYALVLADAHYGIEFQLKDLFGNIINEYSPEIFEKRMKYLFSCVLETIEKEHITELSIYSLGDEIQGLLRLTSQLMQLRYGVVESAILYAEYLASWLNELSKYVHIRFQIVFDSNHNQLRLCNAPKNAFPDENMSVVIKSFLKERLVDNTNIEIIDNPTGMIYEELSGSKILCIHGEIKNLSRAIDEFSRIHNVRLNYLIAGHVHHSDSQEVGIDTEVLHVRSIIGVDPYGLSLNKTSNAGAALFVFEEGKGKVCEYTYKLD